VEPKESLLSKIVVPMPQVNPITGAQEHGAAFETRIVNPTNLLVANYNVIEHNAYKGLRGGRLNCVFELARVLCQPRPEPIVRKRRSAAAVPVLKKVQKKEVCERFVLLRGSNLCARTGIG
jgi:hypothetical protein